MKQSIIVCTVLVMLALSACIRIEAIDENRPHLLRRPIDANAVAVGISMKVRLLFGLSNQPAHGAYFVRLEEKEDISRQDRLIYSDTWSHGYIYLLNAQPGRYAVVAITSSRDLYVLPKSLIQQTVTMVAPGTIGYLGDYVVERAWRGVSSFDDSIEDYYARLLSGPYYRYLFIADLLNGTHDEQGEKQFLRLTDEGLLKQSGGTWSLWIQQRIQMLH